MESWEGIQNATGGSGRDTDSGALPTGAGLQQTSLIPSEEKFREELTKVPKCLKS